MTLLPASLLTAHHTFKSAGFTLTNCVQEAESHEYSAYRFELNGKRIIFRAAKTTPTKIGQFVTLWKRSGNGPITPFDINDAFDFCVIWVNNGEKEGLFVFSKDILHQQGYASVNGKGGKRGMRVYSSWDTPESVQARKTQAWQSHYFYALHQPADVMRLRHLLEK